MKVSPMQRADAAMGISIGLAALAGAAMVVSKRK